MKCMTCFITLVCFCYGSIPGIGAQTGRTQPQSHQKSSQPQKPTQDPQQTEGWQTSFATFAQEIAAWRGEIAAGGFEGLLVEGHVVPRDYGIMKKYGYKPVRWEGVFRSAEKKSLPPEHKNQAVQITLEMDKAAEVARVFVFARDSAFDEWQKVKPGTRVSFRAQVVGIVKYHVPIRGGVNLQYVTLHDVTYLGEAEKTSKPQ